MKISWILTAIILVIAFIGMVLFYNNIVNIDELSAFGSIFAAAGSLIAVVWFYNSLQQQGIQLKEQRQQFQLEFNNLRIESKRNLISLAKSILDDMETDINKSLEGTDTLEDLPVLFMTKALPLLKPIMDSDDVTTVLDAIKEYNSIMKPLNTFLSIIKNVTILFLENDGHGYISDPVRLEQFIYLHRYTIKDKPFISKYYPTAILLAEQMNRLNLDIVIIATETALALNEPRFMITSKILQDVLAYKEKNEYLPTIAEKWLESISKKEKEINQI